MNWNAPMKYFEWKTAVIEAAAESMAISHSDAAGIIEAQQSCGKGMDAQLTAAKVIEAAQEQAEERAVTPAPKPSTCWAEAVEGRGFRVRETGRNYQ